ncbi:MAG: hypothetical protein IJA41_01655 [Clostridia bacterium]|nr:hypothetical protein [Clostridia bacterium]
MYNVKIDCSVAKKVIADDMILTKGVATTAGSKMLEGFMSLFTSEALVRLEEKGYGLVGKAKVGEFGFDLLGETAVNGALTADGVLKLAAAEAVLANEADVALTMDINGSVRRAAAQTGLVSVKPTYGTVSRYGTIPVACSGETVSLMAKNVADVKDALAAVAGHDPKDGTSLPDSMYVTDAATPKRIAVLTDMLANVNADVKAKVDSAVAALKADGIEVVEVTNDKIAAAKVAWNILMSAELCNNVSRYDGVKFGYRTPNFTNLDELYMNSRTEGFGELLKTAILFGSETLSTDNYMKVYDKALRIRRVVVEEFKRLFQEFDAVLMPACSTLEYTVDAVNNDKYMAFNENFYTAPASISGLPAVVAGGVQLVGKAFSEDKLFTLAEKLEKEGK